MEDTLYDLFGVEKASYLTFASELNNQESSIGAQQIEYCIKRDQSSYWKAIRETISEHYSKEPILIFMPTKTKITEVKKLCEMMDLEYADAVDDRSLEQLLGSIRERNRGVVATLASYGRGADIRFKTDSFVIIGFVPKEIDSVRQMTGRSSRTMRLSRSKIVAMDKFETDESIVQKLAGSN